MQSIVSFFNARQHMDFFGAYRNGNFCIGGHCVRHFGNFQTRSADRHLPGSATGAIQEIAGADEVGHKRVGRSVR